MTPIIFKPPAASQGGPSAVVEGKIAAVRSALQGGTPETIRSATDELNASMQQIGQAVYGAQAPGENGASEGEGVDGEAAPPEEGTVEGEYREV